MRIEYIIIAFSVLAVYAMLAQPKADFEVSEIFLADYPSDVGEFSYADFIVFINDAREGRNYTATVFFNDEQQRTFSLKNGANSLYFNPSGDDDSRVRVVIYDNENEFNGYGSKAEPWELFFTVKVNAIMYAE
jgi:hypothetical protein